MPLVRGSIPDAMRRTGREPTKSKVQYKLCAGSSRIGVRQPAKSTSNTCRRYLAGDVAYVKGLRMDRDWEAFSFSCNVRATLLVSGK